MAHNKAAWGADHAEDFARIEAERAASRRLIDIADVRAGYTSFVQQFATASERTAIDAAFVALAALEGDDFENAIGELDQKIYGLSRAALAAYWQAA